MKSPDSPRLDDDKAEESRRRLVDCVLELQSVPIIGARVVANVSLIDTVATTIAHKLGRAPIFVSPSSPRGAVTAGRIDEVRNASNDRTKTIILTATGYGATIAVDVLVV